MLPSPNVQHCVDCLLTLRYTSKPPALDCVITLEHKTYFTQSTLNFQFKKECCNIVIWNSRQTHRNFLIFGTLCVIYFVRDPHISFIFQWQLLIWVHVLRRNSVTRQGAGRGCERWDRRKSQFFETTVQEHRKEGTQADLDCEPSPTHQLWTSTIPQPQNQEGGEAQMLVRGWRWRHASNIFPHKN